MNKQDDYQIEHEAQHVSKQTNVNHSENLINDSKVHPADLSYHENQEEVFSPVEQSYEDSQEPEQQNNGEQEVRKVSLLKFFSFCDNKDKFLLFAGLFSAILAGAILPMISLVMGNVAAAFTGNDGGSSTLMSEMNLIVTYVILISMGQFIFSYIFYAFWQQLAENISNDLRKRYLSSLMKQEVEFFEQQNIEQIPAQMNELFDVVQSSLGEKIATFIFACSSCVAGIVYAMIYGFGYGGLCALYLPVLMTVIGVFGMKVKKSALDRMNVIKHLGGIAEESLTAIKVVASFGREEREQTKFQHWCEESTKVSKIATRTMSFMIGLMKFTTFTFYTYAMLLGTRYILYHDYSQQQVISALIALITGFVQLIASLPNVQAFVQLTTLGPIIFDVIERQPKVTNSKVCIKGEAITLKHHIKFQNVTFKYPTAPKEFKPTLQNVNFEIQAGESTAIVGPSGSGKSTIVQLVDRFYDVNTDGKICFDGKNIRDVDLKVLRESIGYVSQEPVMIMGTIRDNLLYGNKDATEEDMKDALNKASANFVWEQENQLDTFVGVAGIVNMSGGQKQRIAIARALIRKPKILILDEATSALDPKSEIEVQGAIDEIQKRDKDLTILIIAHRLTTIQSAENLLFFKNRSELVSASKGTHDYDDIIEKLKNIQYAQGVEVENEEESSSSNEYGSEDELPLLENEPIVEEIDEGECSDENDEDQLNSVKGSSKPHHVSRRIRESGSMKKSKHQINNNHSVNQRSDEEEDDYDLLVNSGDQSARDASQSHNHRRTNSYPEKTEDFQSTKNLQLSPTSDSYALGKKSKVYRSATGMQLKSIQALKVSGAGLKGSGASLRKRQSNSSLLSPSNKRDRSSTRKDSFKGPRKSGYAMSIASSCDSNEPNFEQNKLKGEEFYRELTATEMMTYYDPKWMAYTGFAASICCAFTMPLFGFCLSKYIIAIGAQKSTEAEIAAFKSEADHWTLIFFFFTLAIGSCTYVQRLSFGIGGDNLSYTLRIKLFGAILRKHIGWFDSKDHAPGILTNILIEDISKVNGLTTESLAIMIEAGLGLGAACFLCFFFSAKVAIVVTLISPFMALGGVGMSKLGVNSAEVDTAYKAANAMLSDLVLNYKTVITFGEKNVETLLFRYSELLIIPHKAGVKRAHISGLFFGYSQAIRFIFVGVVFYVAAVFLNADPTLDSNEVYTGCYMVFVGAIGAGVALSFMPSMSAAKQSAKKVFGIIEEQSVIDPRQSGHANISHGRIEFDQVSFRYPSRKRYVLRHFNLKIEPNTSVAIVGHSGSGKSTIAGLLLRFYDSRKGKIVIDGRDIKDYSVNDLRNQIAIVQQEPMLFNESIKGNILFGQQSASDQRVRAVAIQANALGFIMQSDEDVNNAEVQEKMRKLFDEIRRLHLDPSKHRRLANVVTEELQCSKPSLDYKHLWLICEVLPYMNAKGLDELEANYKIFKDLVKAKAYKSDVTWQEVVKCIEWRKEAKKIEDFMPEIQNDDVKKEIKICLQTNECQFDLKLIKLYLAELENEEYEIKFSTHIRKEGMHVGRHYEEWLTHFVDEKKIREAEASLHPGFQKNCGLKGSQLSGGQKQRVAIARALIKDPKILILDEATSALDEQSQEIVQAALDKAMDGRTSIVIAHRLSTIMKCDRIVVIQKGQVVEDGTYESLSAITGGHFSRLKAGIA